MSLLKAASSATPLSTARSYRRNLSINGFSLVSFSPKYLAGFCKLTIETKIKFPD